MVSKSMLCFPLQEYVKARLLQFVGEPIFAKRMYQTAEGVQRAAGEVLTKLSIPAGKSLPDRACGAYTLLFRHECRCVQIVAGVISGRLNVQLSCQGMLA